MKYIIDVDDDNQIDAEWLSSQGGVGIKFGRYTSGSKLLNSIRPYDPPHGKYEATPQDTYDQLFGSGAFTYSWWRGEDSTGIDEEGEVQPDWSVELSCEDGEADEGEPYIKTTVTHRSILDLARSILENNKHDVGEHLIAQCAYLLYDKDALDFDAAASDTFLQILVLGEVVFG